MKDYVYFGMDNRRIKARFDRSQLKLGSVVFVGPDPKTSDPCFKSEAFDGSTKRYVQWIAPSEWYVVLANSFEVPEYLTEEAHNALEGRMERAEIEACLAAASGGIRPAHQYKTAEFEGSSLGLIKQICERLDLVSRLTSEGVEVRLHHQHEPLIVYLMLTCIDRLGQPTPWLSFDAWLRAKRVDEEREAALAKAKHLGLKEAVRAVHENWLARYGSQTSFHRGFNDVLPASARQRILDSILIHRNRTPPDIEPLPVDDSYKLKWLHQLRHDYTHKAQFIPGFPKSVFDLFEIPKGTWMGMRRQEIRATEWISVTLRRWPDVLVDGVRDGLASYVRAQKGRAI